MIDFKRVMFHKKSLPSKPGLDHHLYASSTELHQQNICYFKASLSGSPRLENGVRISTSVVRDMHVTTIVLKITSTFLTSPRLENRSRPKTTNNHPPYALFQLVPPVSSALGYGHAIIDDRPIGWGPVR